MYTFHCKFTKYFNGMSHTNGSDSTKSMCTYISFKKFTG